MTSAQTRQLTRILYATAVALGAAYLLLLAGMGRGVPGPGTIEADAVPDLQLSETQVELPGLALYDDLTQRPLFAENRRPEPKVAADPNANPEAPPSVPLNVALTGIIHTPRARIALVRDNNTGKSLNLRERMPLPGDQGSWLVKTIEPKRVVFEDTGTQTESVLELAIAGTGASPPPPGQPTPVQPGMNPTAASATALAPAEDEVAQRAAEIRRRIEERRAQLRREAEQAQKQ